MLLIHVVMQVCALHTEAGFRMECLVLNIKGTYFLNDNFHWIFFFFLQSTNEVSAACLAVLALTEYGRDPSAESYEILACWGYAELPILHLGAQNT